MKCPACDAYIDVSSSNSHIICTECHNSVYIETRSLQSDPIKEQIPPLSSGTIVKIANDGHPFNGEICIITDKKHKHYRVDIGGCKVWVPDYWVKYYEP